MKNKRIFLLIILIILWITGLVSYIFWEKENFKNINWNITAYKEYNWVEEYNINKDIYIFRTKNKFSLSYFKRWKTIQDLINNKTENHKNTLITINWNYFWYNEEKLAKWEKIFIPAGFFQKDWKIIKKEIPGDTNLTTYISEDWNTLYFNNPEKIKSWINTFQAGPFIIKNNIINKLEIENSTHWKTKHYRTLIWKDNKWYNYFILTTWKYKLQNLAIILLNIQEFKKYTLNIINLDGGPSTAYYNTIQKEWFNTNSTLPFFINIYFPTK